MNFFLEKIKMHAAVFLGCVAASFFLGYYWFFFFGPNDDVQIKKVHPATFTARFVNPILFQETLGGTKKELLEDKKLEAAATAHLPVQEGNMRVSVYYRNMETGHWFGVNENDTYAPASLIKVPIMIAYLKAAENDPDVLRRKVLYERIATSANEFQTLTPGRQYTIEELIEAMIVKSDNDARDILLQSRVVLGINEFDEVFSDLGITIPTSQNSREYAISPKTFTLFLRVLYNGSYLNWNNSEKALAIMNQTDFKDGLVRGVPSDIQVSHKFGQYVSTERGNNSAEEKIYEIHDCGIIYKLSSPYALCVMTHGKDKQNLYEIVANISRAVYQNSD